MKASQDESLQRRIEDGSYYRDAREWYNHLYIAPISQRIFFIVVTCFTLCIFAVAVIAILNLLPISPRVPFVYRAKDMMNEHPRMERFKEPNEDSNPALVKYFLRTYVEMRESYNSRRYLMFKAFTKQYSASDVFNMYEQETNPNNPRSPIRIYGKFVDLKVDVQKVSYSLEQAPFSANVDFSTEVIGLGSRTKTNWTATIRFEYTNLVERNTYDEGLGDYVLDFDEPTFRVIGYEKRERFESKNN